MQELLTALKQFDGCGMIFTMPNADTYSRSLFNQIRMFCESHPLARVYTSLGQLRYLSCIQFVEVVVGNSSSGLAEVPSCNKGTVNIGDRQRGRLHADSVINCSPDHLSISQAINHLFSPSFLASLKKVKNPYGDGGASESILEILETRPFTDSPKKSFYDLNF